MGIRCISYAVRFRDRTRSCRWFYPPTEIGATKSCKGRHIVKQDACSDNRAGDAGWTARAAVYRCPLERKRMPLQSASMIPPAFCSAQGRRGKERSFRLARQNFLARTSSSAALSSVAFASNRLGLALRSKTPPNAPDLYTSISFSALFDEFKSRPKGFGLR